ncbi:Peroxin 22-like protein [Pleurostoma richardsiae]|uniref:Peroxin 22-like protein n=1 Tax=Pleurostoma richardsiae TaxID=41990 RepID=A0AA38RFF5_9PEZI|nr:Peroxin 22-like protein [Pleurostoma richardsiae]
MSSPYDRYDRGSSRRRGVWSHWVPLAVTVTVATVGVAAWIWSQRNNDEEEDAAVNAQDLDYENADYGDNPPYGATGDGGRSGAPPSFADGELRAGETGYGTTQLQPEAAGSSTWGSRMSGALRRTPSPQQFLDSAGKTVAAGVAAAGAAVGSALASIREEDKTAYADHETWSEEADAKKDRPLAPHSKEASKRRKTVAIVVSADTQLEDIDEDGYHEHASILSHIPRHNDFSKIKLFVLIYAPGMKDAAGDATSNLPPPSLSSSFSNIGHDQAQTPADETKSPLLTSSANPAFNAVYSQALGLVEKESMILPFTSANGHVHILRHLQPEVIYLQESLAGDNGSVITQLQTWLRYDVILVVGAESGHGGLADSESEAEKPEKEQKWWQNEDRVGRGRGVVVVDGMRVHDDWSRRVQGIE